MAFTASLSGTVGGAPVTFYADDKGVSLSMNAGVSPSSGTFYLGVNTFPVSLPANATLTMNDGTTEIQLAVRLKEGKVSATPRSKDVPITFVDRRWKWQYGYINGIYNQPDTEGDPSNEFDARTLATWCLNAMGEEVGTDDATHPDATAYVGNIPNDEYPAVKWEAHNPAKALQEILDQVGCLISLRYDDKAECFLMTQTEDLPDGAGDFYTAEETGDAVPDRPPDNA